MAANGLPNNLPAPCMSLSPTVLYPLTLPALLNYVLATQAHTASTTLVICASRDDFLQQLSYSLEDNEPEEEHGGLLVQALLAYLTAYGRSASNTPVVDGSEKVKQLVLVNPLSLHNPTPFFSAQGLSRTFSAVVEAGLRTKTVLRIAECKMKSGGLVEQEDGDEDEDMDDGNGSENDAAGLEEDPWEQQVSILNISSRKFGSGVGERAWAGRVVKVKRIAARWFQFHKLGDG